MTRKIFEYITSENSPNFVEDKIQKSKKPKENKLKENYAYTHHK